MRRQWLWLSVVLLAGAADRATATGPLIGRKLPEIVIPATVPWQELSERTRSLARPVLEKPTLAARGPAESFYGSPAHYAWFLDHPDRAVGVWRRMGAQCVSITARPDGKFGWVDDQGSEIVWETVHRTDGMRIWYAEGKVRPGPVMPLVGVKALVVVSYHDGKAGDGRPVIHHQSDLFVQTDSKAAAAVARMMGTSAQRGAEQGLGQLQLFFSGPSWYLERHPRHAEELLRAEAPPPQSARVNRITP